MSGWGRVSLGEGDADVSMSSGSSRTDGKCSFRSSVASATLPERICSLISGQVPECYDVRTCRPAIGDTNLFLTAPVL